MSVMRVNKNKNYTQMSNVHLRDETLSLKAKGLLSVVLSLPEDWKYSIKGLVSICKESETSVKSALDELKEHKYLVVTKIMPNKENNGRYEYVYDFYEVPQIQEGKKQEVENQGVEFLPIENQAVEKHPLYQLPNLSTTKEQNTEIAITDNNSKAKAKKEKFVKPSVEEIQDYINEKQYSVNAQYFYNYYEGNDWHVGSHKMKNWQRTVDNWEIRNKERLNNLYTNTKPVTNINPYTNGNPYTNSDL